MTTPSRHLASSRRTASDLLADWERWNPLERVFALAAPVLSIIGVLVTAVLLQH